MSALPLFLAVDTSTLRLSAALVQGEEVVAQVDLEAERGHGRQLLALCDKITKEAGSSLAQIDAFAVGLGPGSFTGLRIGLALFKGLAFAYQKPLFGGSSLRAAAARYAKVGALLCPCMDARKAEVYTALYRAQEGLVLQPRLDERVIAPRLLVEELLFAAPGDEKIWFGGTGAHEYRGVLASAFGARAEFVPEDESAPWAVDLARQAQARMAVGAV